MTRGLARKASTQQLLAENTRTSPFQILQTIIALHINSAALVVMHVAETLLTTYERL